MSLDNWFQVGFGVLFLISLLCGLKWKQAKALLKEVAEALTATSAALEDDDITLSERKKLLKEWKEVILAAKTLAGR